MPGAGCLHDINWKATLLRPITIFAVSNMQVQDGKDNHTKNDSLKTKRAGFEAYPFSYLSGSIQKPVLILTNNREGGNRQCPAFLMEQNYCLQNRSTKCKPQRISAIASGNGLFFHGGKPKIWSIYNFYISPQI